MNTDNEIYYSIDYSKIDRDAFDSISSNILSKSIKDNLNNSLSSVGNSMNDVYKIPEFNLVIRNSTMGTPMFMGQLVGLFKERVSVVTEELDTFFDNLEYNEYSYITFEANNNTIHRVLNVNLTYSIPYNAYPTYDFEEFGSNNMLEELSRLANVNNNLEVIIEVEPPF